MSIYKLINDTEPKEGSIKSFDNSKEIHQYINGKYRSIYNKLSDGNECWIEYSNKGQMVHIKYTGKDNKIHEHYFDDKIRYVKKEEFEKIWEKLN